MYDEQTITLNSNIEINYLRTPSAGSPLVLLHGVASEWQSFLPLIPVLAREFQVYAIDLRGHGKSSWITDGYRLIDYARDIHSFLEQQITQPAIIYGHSLGAQIAIALAAQAPAHVRALILGDPPFYFHNLKTRDSVWYEPFVEMYQLISTMHSAQELDDYMAEHYPNMEPQRRKARAKTLSHVDPGVIATILEECNLEGYDTDILLKQIACPVLLLQGNTVMGSALRAEDVTYITERIPRCEIVHMKDVGHGLPLGESLSKVETFLKTI